MSTFTLPKYYEGTPGKDIMYHGVGKNRSSFYLGYVLRAKNKCTTTKSGDLCISIEF